MSARSGKQVSRKTDLRLIKKEGRDARPASGKSDNGGPDHDLNQVLTLIGAGESCDIVLDSDRIDHAHAAIVKLGDGAYACDLGAPSGTTINGKRIRWVKLTDADVMTIGPFSFLVEVGTQKSDSTEEQPVFRLRNEASIGIITSIDPVLLIGSDPGCDIMLDEDSVSPRHCLVAWTKEGPILRDLQRSHPTRLNGRRTHSGRLANGDSIGIGRYELTFETETKLPEPSNESDSIIEWAGGDTVNPSAIISGRLSTDWTDKIEGLWDPTCEKPQCSTSGNAKSGDGKQMPAPEEAASFDSVSDSKSTSTKSTEPASVKSDSKETMMVKGKKDVANETTTDRPSADEISEVQSEKQLEDKASELRARVTAAQHALDERARKYREGLDEERRKLEARQTELQRQAKALRAAALGVHSEAAGEPQNVEGQSVFFKDFQDKSNIDLLASGRIDLSAPQVHSVPENDQSSESLIEGVISGVSDPTKLEQRVAELVELAKTERSEIERGEAMIETLRLETERLRTTVMRRQEKLQARRTNLEERFKSLERTREVIRTEREPLSARLRKLDSEEASIRARMADGERIRRELDQEAELLNQAQQRLKTRQTELFNSLELERQRLQQRQSAMQVKTAELEQFLHGRLSDIEVELSARRADMETRPQPGRDSAPSSAISSIGTTTNSRTDGAGLDASEQLAALNRIEQQAFEGESRLDALQRRIEALGSGGSVSSGGSNSSSSKSTKEPGSNDGKTRLTQAWKGARGDANAGLRMESSEIGVTNGSSENGEDASENIAKTKESTAATKHA